MHYTIPMNVFEGASIPYYSESVSKLNEVFRKRKFRGRDLRRLGKSMGEINGCVMSLKKL